MAEAEFNSLAGAYERQHADSIWLSGESTDYFAAYKIVDVAKTLRKRDIVPKTILDFGTGIGASIAHLSDTFPDARLHGVDVSRESIAMAKARYADRAVLKDYDGVTLPYADATFDVVFTACVFHHISPEAHLGLLAEIRRVLRPGGYFFLFEHNPWNPATRHAVKICPFDANAILISAPQMLSRISNAGFCSVERKYRIFFPRQLRALRPIEAALTWLPIGGQYYCVALASQ